MCGRQHHYTKTCPEIEYHKRYKKVHISRECPLRESGYSSGHSSDRMRQEFLYSSRRRYEYECLVSVGTVRSASRNTIIDGHYDIWFTERPNSSIVAVFLHVLCVIHLVQPCAFINSGCWLLCN